MINPFYVSDCCRANVEISGNGTTHYYICSRCKRPCNIIYSFTDESLDFSNITSYFDYSKKYKFIFKGNPLSKDNEKIRNKQGKYFLSRKYKQYEKDLQYQFLAQKPKDFKMLTGKLAVILKLYFKDNRVRDTHNYTKSIFDAFNGLMYKDDKQFCEEHLYRNIDKENPRVELIVWEL